MSTGDRRDLPATRPTGQDIAATADYAQLRDVILAQASAARERASRAVNTELVLLYWSIGRAILAEQERHAWGDDVVGLLAQDLRATGDLGRGFSRRNLFYMRRFAALWPDEQKVPPLAAQIGKDPYVLDFIDIAEDLNAVDDQLRHPDDGERIGLILCTTQQPDRREVRPTPQRRAPIAVADWQTDPHAADCQRRSGRFVGGITLVQETRLDLLGGVGDVACQLVADLGKSGELRAQRLREFVGDVDDAPQLVPAQRSPPGVGQGGDRHPSRPEATIA